MLCKMETFYIHPPINFKMIDIAKINSEIDIATQSKTLMLSDKLKISLVLLERMTMGTVKLIRSKIQSIGALNDVIIKLLQEARTISLNDMKRLFLSLSAVDGSCAYIITNSLRTTITDHPKSLVLFIENILDCLNSECIDELIKSKHESIVFNIMRKTIISENREYIYANIDKIENKGVQMLMRKEYMKTG